MRRSRGREEQAGTPEHEADAEGPLSAEPRLSYRMIEGENQVEIFDPRTRKTAGTISRSRNGGWTAAHPGRDADGGEAVGAAAGSMTEAIAMIVRAWREAGDHGGAPGRDAQP